MVVGTSETFSISTIDPIPIVDDPADQVHCEGDNTNDVIFSGPNPTTSFIWTNDNTSIGLAASGSGDILSFIAIIQVLLIRCYYYSYTGI